MSPNFVPPRLPRTLRPLGAAAALMILLVLSALPGGSAMGLPLGLGSSGSPAPAAPVLRPLVRFTWPASRVASAPGVATLDVPGPGGDFTVPYIQTSPDLRYALELNGPPGRTFVDVVLDIGQQGQRTQRLSGPPWTGTFSGVDFGEHTLDAHLYVPEEGVPPSVALSQPPIAAIHLAGVARGDIVAALGDSITEGLKGGPFAPAEVDRLQTFDDWTAAGGALRAMDPGSVSPDGRNFPQPGATMHPASRPGFEVPLGTLLASRRGHPVLVLNEGWSGTTSAAYLHIVESDFFRSVVSATRPNVWLIDLGANDAVDHRAADDYRAQLQTMIGDLRGLGATPADIHLACPSYGQEQVRLQLEPTYLPVVDALRAASGLGPAPNFYSYYRDHPELLADTVHPNTAGYQAMAQLWADALSGSGAGCAG